MVRGMEVLTRMPRAPAAVHGRRDRGCRGRQRALVLLRLGEMMLLLGGIQVMVLRERTGLGRVLLAVMEARMLLLRLLRMVLGRRLLLLLVWLLLLLLLLMEGHVLELRPEFVRVQRSEIPAPAVLKWTQLMEGILVTPSQAQRCRSTPVAFARDSTHPDRAASTPAAVPAPTRSSPEQRRFHEEEIRTMLCPPAREEGWMHRLLMSVETRCRGGGHGAGLAVQVVRGGRTCRHRATPSASPATTLEAPGSGLDRPDVCRARRRNPTHRRWRRRTIPRTARGPEQGRMRRRMQGRPCRRVQQLLPLLLGLCWLELPVMLLLCLLLLLLLLFLLVMLTTELQESFSPRTTLVPGLRPVPDIRHEIGFLGSPACETLQGLLLLGFRPGCCEVTPDLEDREEPPGQDSFLRRESRTGFRIHDDEEIPSQRTHGEGQLHMLQSRHVRSPRLEDLVETTSRRRRETR